LSILSLIACSSSRCNLFAFSSADSFGAFCHQTQEDQVCCFVCGGVSRKLFNQVVAELAASTCSAVHFTLNCVLASVLHNHISVLILDIVPSIHVILSISLLIHDNMLHIALFTAFDILVVMSLIHKKLLDHAE
jgi:hypothetical protein